MSVNKEKNFTSFEIPFILKDGIIVVEAFINDQQGYFLFDSGAPDMILNTDYLDVVKLEDTDINALGVGGNISIQTYEIDSFKWGDIYLNNFEAYAMSFKHLEEILERKISGLIGYHLIKEFQITYDYRRSVLKFEKTDEYGNKESEEQIQPAITIPFEQVAHLPVFPIEIDGNTYQMGLDSGAAENMLSAQHFQDLLSNGSLELSHDDYPVQGAGTEVRNVKAATIPSTIIGGLKYPDMFFVFTDDALAQLNELSPIRVDGLLGFQFLKKYKTVINYLQREIRIYL